MKKLKLRKWVKYTALGMVDLGFILNIPNIIKNTETLSGYRYNIIVLGIFFLINILVISLIEDKRV